MNFSVNQTRHFYVVNNAVAGSKLTNTATAGTIRPVETSDKEYLYFEYKGADNVMRSDLIKKSEIMYTKCTTADKLRYLLKNRIVRLDASVNGGNPIVGQDYIVKIEIRNFAGFGDDTTMTKYGIVHAVTGMTAPKFYATLALSLAKNFSRDAVPMFKFLLEKEGGTPDLVEVTPNTKIETLTDNYTGVKIQEVEQPWSLGLDAQMPVNFTVSTDTVVYNGEEVTWGIATDIDEPEETDYVDNGKKIADMEYFYMGERGDIYRNVGWPNVIKTTYLTDPNKKYDVIDIHYAYSGANEAIQKSEKDITIAIDPTYTEAFLTALNKVLPSNFAVSK